MPKIPRMEFTRILLNEERKRKEEKKMIILYLERRNYIVGSFNIFITPTGKELIRLSLYNRANKKLSFDIPYSLALEERLINLLEECPEEVALMHQREGRPTFSIRKLPSYVRESYLVALGIPLSHLEKSPKKKVRRGK